MIKVRTKQEMIAAVGLTATLIAIFFIFVFYINFKTTQAPTQNMAVAIQTSNSINVPVPPIRSINIKAKAAYVKDLNSGQIIYAKNENDRLPLASLTKIMTALIAKKNADGNQLVQVSAADVETEGEYYILPQEIFKLKDLIDFTMIGSVNDTASAISGILNSKDNFIIEMNKTARQIGLHNSTFESETGLDLYNGNVSSANGTAKDVSTLLEYTLKNYPDIFEATTNDSLTIKSLAGQSHMVENTDKIIDKLSGLIGSKTGYTDLAGGNLALIVDLGLNEPISIVILGSPDSETRFDDAIKILDNIRNNS